MLSHIFVGELSLTSSVIGDAAPADVLESSHGGGGPDIGPDQQPFERPIALSLLA